MVWNSAGLWAGSDGVWLRAAVLVVPSSWSHQAGLVTLAGWVAQVSGIWKIGFELSVERVRLA
jgi:hypothetical protein